MTQEPESKYLIQEQAADGNYSDSIGLSAFHSRISAEQELKNWQIAFPSRKCRLILRLDVPLLY